MTTKKLTLKACLAVAKNKQGAILLHALLTTKWPDERLVIRDGEVWVNTVDTLWLAYASTDEAHNETCELFMDGLVDHQEDNDWSHVRPTRDCLEALGLNAGGHWAALT
jgi:hypothetical protein